MQVAVLHEDLEDLAGLVLEQAVVGQHHGGPAAGLEDVHHVLDEVELLVAGLDGEVVALGRLVGALGAEGRVGQDAVVALAAVGLVDGIARGRCVGSRPCRKRFIRASRRGRGTRSWPK